MRSVKMLSVIMGLAIACDVAAAATIPLPRPRPEGAPSAIQSALEPEEPAPPSACMLRLAPKLAIATALPRVEGNGGCGAEDVVRLEAVMLPDKKRVAVIPPAVMRCSLAEAVANWVREDIAPAVREFGSPLQSVDNYA